MYQTASWSVVHAIDARTGKKIWTFDPGVDREKGYKGCCDVVNRGVALYKGKVFVAAYDGRLIALDAATGAKVWEKDTLIDHDHSYTITGAPRVFNGKVRDRQWRRGIRRARLRHRLRRRNRQSGLALVHRARRSLQAVRGRLDGGRGQDLGSRRQILDQWRRRHAVGHHHLSIPI